MNMHVAHRKWRFSLRKCSGIQDLRGQEEWVIELRHVGIVVQPIAIVSGGVCYDRQTREPEGEVDILRVGLRVHDSTESMRRLQRRKGQQNAAEVAGMLHRIAPRQERSILTDA